MAGANDRHLADPPRWTHVALGSGCSHLRAPTSDEGTTVSAVSIPCAAVPGPFPRPRLMSAPTSAPQRPAARAARPGASPESTVRIRTEPGWVVVDYENLAGTGDPGHGLIKSVWTSLRRVLVPGDKVVIATGALCGSPVKYCLGYTGAQFLMRSGKNGAENALLENTDLSEVAKGYRWLVVASGDGRLTSLAQDATARGMRVWQITGIGKGHPNLTQAATVHSRLHITVPGRQVELRTA